jgi:hypothetical protein
MHVVILYGPPAVGKLTVAQHLSLLTGYSILHNHLLIDLAIAVYGRGTETSRKLSKHIRKVIIEDTHTRGLPGLILTLVHSQARETYIKTLVADVRSIGATAQLVHLSADQTSLERRVLEPSRLQFDKLTTVDGLRQKLAELKTPFAVIEGSLSINTDALSASEAATVIRHHLNLSIEDCQ